MSQIKCPLIILIFLLISGCSAFAIVDDVYFCQTSKIVEIDEENVEEFKEQRFTFKRSKYNLFFGEEGYFNGLTKPIELSLDDKEFFIATDELNTFTIHYQDGEFNYSSFKFGTGTIVIMADCEIF
tara:strand:- start:193 stop:570 length:378 start_codon:yes stop_codon:yes gene_type:complete